MAATTHRGYFGSEWRSGLTTGKRGPRTMCDCGGRECWLPLCIKVAAVSGSRHFLLKSGGCCCYAAAGCHFDAKWQPALSASTFTAHLSLCPASYQMQIIADHGNAFQWERSRPQGQERLSGARAKLCVDSRLQTNVLLKGKPAGKLIDRGESVTR